MSVCSHGCNKAFQAWIHSRLSSSPHSLLLSAPPAQQMGFPLLSAMWWYVHDHHHPTYFMESSKKRLHSITFPKILEAAVRNFFYLLISRKTLPFIVNIKVLLKKKSYFTLSGMLCVWLQGERLARAADLVLPGNSIDLHALATNYPWAGVC